MRFSSLQKATIDPALTRAPGPVAVIIAEDDVEVAATLRHYRDKGFKTVILCAPPELNYDTDGLEDVIRVDYPTLSVGATSAIVNAIAAALPEKTWLFYGYNAEFLFYPFSETRTVGEMLAFHAEERRFSMLTYVVDVYAGDLGAADNAVSWAMLISTARATTRWPVRTRTARRTVSSTSTAASGGGSRSISTKFGGGSTGYRSSAPGKG